MYLRETLWLVDTGTIVRNDCSKGTTCDFVETKKAQPTSIRYVEGEALSSLWIPLTMFYHIRFAPLIQHADRLHYISYG